MDKVHDLQDKNYYHKFHLENTHKNKTRNHSQDATLDVIRKMNSDLNKNKDPTGFKRREQQVRAASEDLDNPLGFLGVNNDWTLDGKYKRYVQQPDALSQIP